VQLTAKSGSRFVDALVAIGFTALEAEVYGALARGGPSTGYRVAQALGKPAANTYKAIESLHAKGAVLIDDSKARVVRAVPPRELMRIVGRDLDARKKRVSDALADLPVPEADRRIYELGNRAQVFERARTMLAGARRIALLDLGPRPLAELAGDLVKAAARGVTVAVRSEAAPATALPGVELVVIPPRGAAAAEPWPGEWLTLVVDGSEHALAVFTADGELHQGVWSNSAFLAWVFHSGLASEIVVDLAASAALAGQPKRALEDALARLADLAPADAPGRRQLLAMISKPR
jgi:HTH-type transcriptional regulator, sugar sensing transcriptional regulator